jgi:ferredoxin
MKHRVDSTRCSGIGMCEMTAPTLYEVGDDRQSHVVRDEPAADEMTAVEGKPSRAARPRRCRSRSRNAASQFYPRRTPSVKYVVEQERDRLEQMRLGALEERISLELELGRADGVVAELIGSINDHPLRCTHINSSQRYSATNWASNRGPGRDLHRSFCVRHPSF